ncbi:MAG: PAS domain-containing protein [Cyanothece sp. SIO1E1]|nr:PAS domain-containing protein [Cyanothece sp. SIO1E1]
MDPQTAELKRLNGLLREKLSELKQTEAALRESQERYMLAVQGSRDGLWDWNVLTNEVYYAPRFKQILGYQDDEVENQFSTFESRLHPDDHDRVLAAVRDHIESRIPYNVEYRLQTKQGDYRWIYARGQAIWDATGQPTRMAGSISDITERKQVEEALRESEARWQFALEGSGEGVWDWNAKTNEVFFSHQWKAMLGYEDHEVGSNLNEWDSRVHPDDKEQCYSDLNRHLNGQTPIYQNEHRVRCKDGTYKWILDRGKVIERDQAGKPLRVIGTHADITDRKRAEAALRQINEILETKVQERTEELEQRARELERSNTELEQFAYVVSHDLQQPLQGILGFAQILGQIYCDHPNEPINQYIAHIINAGQHMSQLIRDLLDYSRVSTFKQLGEPIDCNHVMEQVLSDLQPIIDDSQAAITTDVLPTIRANESQLMQLFQNLLSNALKYHRLGQPPQVQVSVDHREDEWLFGIHDSGIGIKPEHFDQIFQIFQRLHTKDKYPGTGIGLATCKKIVENHGGRIWVDSEPAAGTTFYFTLPA